jgi:hypothetical protein
MRAGFKANSELVELPGSQVLLIRAEKTIFP